MRRLLGGVREYGRIRNTTAALDRVTRKLGRDGVQLRFCYEAGPCGYGIQRHLTARGHDFVVVAIADPKAAWRPHQDRSARRG
jgi:transposase